MLSEYVKFEVLLRNGQKQSLTINPFGRFQDGTGAIANLYLKPEQLLSSESVQEAYDILLKAVQIENMEGLLEDGLEPILSDLLQYAKEHDETDDNALWIGYFKTLNEKAEAFKSQLPETKEEISSIKAHLIHQASEEECDFADHIGCPFEEDADIMRSWLEENLSEGSEIDALMERFEDGEFFLDSYCADTIKEVSFEKGTSGEKVLVSDVG